MDAETLVESVQTSRATKLDRLSSDRRLLALTGPDLSAARVLSAALQAERVTKETFEQWAQSETNPAVGTVFEEVVQTEIDHVARVQAAGPDTDYGDVDPNALHRYLRSLEETIPRVGAGLVGRPLVASGTTLQFVSFFVNEADTQRADLFRGLRAETKAQLERGEDLLATLCSTQGEWDTARDAAESTIDVAYDEYADELTAMGIDPKSVC